MIGVFRRSVVEKGKDLNGIDEARPLVSIVIPAFNEQENIANVLERTCETAESDVLSYEIIVIDDGSTDRTRELANQHKVIVLTNGVNKGKGAALRKGFAHAQGEIVVTMDADGSHNPEDIPKLLLPVLNGATLALGSRFASEEGKRSTKRLNILGNTLINLSIMMLTGKRITDSQSGFRAIQRSFLSELNLTSDGYEMETEVLTRALVDGGVVKEVPLIINKRRNGHSHLNPLGDGIKIMRTIVRSIVVT